MRLRVGWGGYYFGWSQQHPAGYAAPLRTKRQPPLLFATETEAEVAHDAYLAMTADPYPASVVQVRASPTHRPTNAGFAPVPLAAAFALFADLLSTPPPTAGSAAQLPEASTPNLPKSGLTSAPQLPAPTIPPARA